MGRDRTTTISHDFPQKNIIDIYKMFMMLIYVSICETRLPYFNISKI